MSSSVETTNSSKATENTVVVEDKSGKTPPFVRCNSSEPFVNPIAPNDKTSKQINEELNLNLGQSLIVPENTKLRKLLRFLNDFLFSWYEDYVFALWNAIPLRFRQSLTFFLWGWWVQLHKRILGRRTAIHEDASEEYHALTTLMWAGRLFPVTIKRMRFSLSQLTVWTRTPLTASVVRIKEEYKPIEQIPAVQEDHTTVEGIYLHTQAGPTEKVIFWLYGGAFLSGDVDGNTGPGMCVG